MKTVLAVACRAGRKGIPVERQAPLPTESLGLAYLARALDDAGAEVVVVDGYQRGWTVEQTVERLLHLLDERDLLGFSVNHALVLGTAQAVTSLRAQGFAGPIVLGGWEATLAPRQLLAHVKGADWVIRGEAEAALPLLARRLAREQSADGLPGLQSRGADPADAAINVVAFARPPFPLHHAPPARAGAPPLPVQASRGCAHGRCTFCTTPAATGRSWRPREVDHLVAELAHDLEAHGARHRVFVDDEFLGPTPAGLTRAARLADALTAAGLDLPLTLDCRATDYRPALFERLRQAGVVRIFLGLESGSDGVLRRLGKGCTAEAARRSLRGLRAQGFDVIPGYILFEPCMSLAELRQAFDFLLEEVRPLTPTRFLNRVVPYVGTGIHRRLEAAGLLEGEYPELDYRFLDPSVDRLHRQLGAETSSIVAAYREALAHSPGMERDRAVAAQVDAVIEIFERLLIGEGR